MTARRKALAGAGVMAAVALGTLTVAAPAYADSVGVQVNGQLADFAPGDSQPLNITVTPGDAAVAPTVTVTVSGLTHFTASNPSGCNSGSGNSCTIRFGANETSRSIRFTIKATSNINPGGTETDPGKVTATSLTGGNASDNFNATVKASAPTQAPIVNSITGTVRNSTTGEAIKGALVLLQDSGGCAPSKPRCETGTDNNGAFKFPQAGRPITAGTITIGVSKTGYETLTRNVEVPAGGSLNNISFNLKATTDPSASATAETLPSAEGQEPTAEGVAPTGGNNAEKASSSSGLSMFSWIILILAIILVLSGVGVFVMMFLNRRKRDAEEADRADAETRGGAPVSGAPRGVYGGGQDATMVGHHGMVAPGASDATAIIRPARPEDEFPDPYAAPYPTNQPGYPPAGGNGYGPGGYAPTQAYSPGQPAGYDPEAQQGYGGAPTTVYGQSGEYGNQYGTPAGYGGEHGYGGAYGGEPGYGGYGGEPGYGGEQPGYGGAPAGYGGEPGYGGEQGYGPGPGGQGPRYDEATRHWDGDAEGYPAAGGHPQQGGYDPGYGQRHGGYDAGGYPPPQDPYYQQEEPPPPPPQGPPAPGRRQGPPAGRGGDRQQLDWLDD